MNAYRRLSIVIPAYDEASRIGPSLARICTYLRASQRAHEIIVVDDGSRDTTAEVVARTAEEHTGIRLVALGANRGKGAAVRAGVLASEGDDVLVTDADLSTPIEELPRLESALAEGADLAVGSRVADGDVEREQPFLRYVQGRLFHLAVRALGFQVVAKIRDTQCGFKLFRGGVARQLFADLTLAGFSFDVELLERAHARFRIAEVPVRWRHVDGSKVRPGLDAMRMLCDLAVIRWAWLRSGRPVLALPAQTRTEAP